MSPRVQWVGRGKRHTHTLSGAPLTHPAPRCGVIAVVLLPARDILALDVQVAGLRLERQARQIHHLLRAPQRAAAAAAREQHGGDDGEREAEDGGYEDVIEAVQGPCVWGGGGWGLEGWIGAGDWGDDDVSG